MSKLFRIIHFQFENPILMYKYVHSKNNLILQYIYVFLYILKTYKF